MPNAAASYRGQAEAFYELAHASDDAMERLAYVLRAMECEARAADLEGEKLPPAYMVDAKCSGDPESE